MSVADSPNGNVPRSSGRLGTARDVPFYAVAVTGVLASAILATTSCQAKEPGSFEGKIAQQAKEVTIGGKDWTNPTADDLASVKEGAEHFQHHCEICHGLDGQNTGVPFVSASAVCPGGRESSLTKRCGTWSGSSGTCPPKGAWVRRRFTRRARTSMKRRRGKGTLPRTIITDGWPKTTTAVQQHQAGGARLLEFCFT
jgi:hypothetical protein